MADTRIWISAKRLKEAMDFWEISVAELAEESGIGGAIINQALKGKFETEWINPRIRHALAGALSISMSALSDMPEQRITGNVLVCSRGKDGPKCEVMSADKVNRLIGGETDGD